MAQQVKGLATEPSDLNLIPEPRADERTDAHNCLLASTCSMAHIPTK